MRDVSFSYQNALGNVDPSDDKHLGFLMYSTLLPTGYSSTNRTKTYYSATLAAQDGISGIAAQAGSSQKAAEFAQLAYHVREYFRVAKALGAANPKLSIGVYAPPDGEDAEDFSAVVAMQNASGGKCRMIGIFRGPTLTTGLCAALKVKLDALRTAHMPCLALYQIDMAYNAPFSTLPDLSEVGVERMIHPLLGSDGAAEGKALTNLYEVSTGALGAILGLYCRTTIGNTAMYVEQGNVATTELDVIEFPNGVMYSDLEVADDGTIPQLIELEEKGYSFLRKYLGVPGTYLNDTLTLALPSSDLDSVENIDLVHHAERRLYALYVRKLGASFKTEEDGTLNTLRISDFIADGNRELAAIATEGKSSGGTLTIDPSQKPSKTTPLEISGTVRALKSAKDIHFTLSLA